MKPALLVLAAGMGSRFGGLKQIEPVGPHGEWILDFSVFDAVRSGFGKAIFVIREEMADAFEAVRRRYADQIEVAFAFQRLDDLPCRRVLAAGRSKPWGTGHAAYAARELIDRPFAVINADDFYGAGAFAALADFLSDASEEPREYALVGYRLENTLSENGSVSRGICHARADGLLESVEEHTQIRLAEDSGTIVGLDGRGECVELDAATPVSLNCWGFPPEFTPELESLFTDFLEDYDPEAGGEFYLPYAVDALIRAGDARARILDCPSRWLGVTHRQDLALVKSEIAKLFDLGRYQTPLWQPS